MRSCLVRLAWIGGALGSMSVLVGLIVFLNAYDRDIPRFAAAWTLFANWAVAAALFLLAAAVAAGFATLADRPRD
jgi:TRAP-type mannitol/chloroaromatic compound transport system permease small subunit